MAEFFALLFLASLGGFAASLTKPEILSKIFISTRKTGASLFGSLAVLSLILLGSTAPDTTVKGTSTTVTPTIEITTTAAPSPTAVPTLTPTPTRVPTVVPTKKPAYTLPTTSNTTQDTTSAPIGGLSNDNYYTNVDGNEVHSPAYSDTVPAGASAICADGTYSFSQNRRGTCSHHGGVATWL